MAAVPGADGTYIQSQLVRHACVLTCAALEQAIMECASAYAGRVGDERLRSFVGEILKTGRNPYPDYICEVLGKFDAAWGVSIKQYMEDEIGSDIVKSVVSNRNRIAHGENVSMGLVSLSQWYPRIRKLCLEIARLLESAHGRRSQVTRARRNRG
jgi:hypothetical protein